MSGPIPSPLFPYWPLLTLYDSDKAFEIAQFRVNRAVEGWGHELNEEAWKELVSNPIKYIPMAFQMRHFDVADQLCRNQLSLFVDASRHYDNRTTSTTSTTSTTTTLDNSTNTHTSYDYSRNAARDYTGNSGSIGNVSAGNTLPHPTPPVPLHASPAADHPANHGAALYSRPAPRSLYLAGQNAPAGGSSGIPTQPNGATNYQGALGVPPQFALYLATHAGNGSSSYPHSTAVPTFDPYASGKKNVGPYSDLMAPSSLAPRPPQPTRASSSGVKTAPFVDEPGGDALEFQSTLGKLAATNAELVSTKENLAAKEVKLELANKDLQLTKKKLVEQGAELELAEGKLAAQAAELESAKKDLATKEMELESTKEKLATKGAELESANKELATKKEESELANEKLTQKDVELDYANTECEGLRGALNDKKHEARRLNEQIKQLEEQLAEETAEDQEGGTASADGHADNNSDENPFIDVEAQLADFKYACF